MCSYNNISFNQPSQKLALVTDNHVYIYDLRTATKWRTIDFDKSHAT
jgi:WD40 repeat protein